MSGLYDYLYAHPSMLEGFARLWDFAGSLNEYNDTASIEDADAIAMWIDWASIGLDMDQAISIFRDDRVTVT